MATYVPKSSTVPVIWSADDDTDNTYDYKVGARLIHENLGYLVDINKTRIFLGFMPNPDTDGIDQATTWSPNIV